MVDTLNSMGAKLTNVAIPLAGATVVGTAFSAAGIKINKAATLAPGTTAAPTEASTGFGSALPLNADGTFSSTGPVRPACPLSVRLCRTISECF